MCYNNKIEDFLDRLQRVINDAGNIMILVEDLEEAFPELKERKDEKVRKALLGMVHDRNDLWIDYDIYKEEAIAWLEKQKPINVHIHTPDGSSIYDKTFEEAQEYLSERGFDVPWNDNDVFVDERYIAQTVANVLAWGDEHPNQKIVSQLEKQDESKIVWHTLSEEEPNENAELLCEWKGETNTWHHIAFYRKANKTFYREPNVRVMDVIRWAYIK